MLSPDSAFAGLAALMDQRHDVERDSVTAMARTAYSTALTAALAQYERQEEQEPRKRNPFWTAAATSLQTMMLESIGPDQPYDVIRSARGLDADSVRRYEDKILKAVANSVFDGTSKPPLNTEATTDEDLQATYALVTDTIHEIERTIATRMPIATGDELDLLGEVALVDSYLRFASVARAFREDEWVWEWLSCLVPEDEMQRVCDAIPPGDSRDAPGFARALAARPGHYALMRTWEARLSSHTDECGFPLDEDEPGGGLPCPAHEILSALYLIEALIADTVGNPDSEYSRVVDRARTAWSENQRRKKSLDALLRTYGNAESP